MSDARETSQASLIFQEKIQMLLAVEELPSEGEI